MSAAVTFDMKAAKQACRGQRLGLVTTPAAWIPELGTALVDHPKSLGNIRAFLALEHGLRGELQDGVRVESYTDARTKLPVFSFYGERKSIPEAFWEAVDIAVFCAQDVSHRAYTFHWALAELIRTAATRHKAVLVLDRPSPLAHLGAAGPVTAQFFPLPFPVLPGLTHGELGAWMVREKGLDVEYRVLPVQGWRRSMPWAETGLPWIPPSPNIPTLDSAYAYACTGLLQATAVSEGRGTCRPFEYIGAPFIDPHRFATALNARGLPGVQFRELYFQPAFNKYAGEVCGGVHLLLTEPLRLNPVRTALVILQELAWLYPDKLELKAEFGAWLDGGKWSAGKLAELDIKGYLEALQARLEEYADSVAPIQDYA